MPERPAESASQKDATSGPSAEMAPTPVITTRRLDRNCRATSAFHQLLHSFGHLAYSADGAGCVIGDVDVELILKREQNINAIQGVDLQLLERAVRQDRVSRNV